MKRIKIVALAALAGSFGLAAPEVMAACTQTDVAGAWQAYSISSDGEWVRCKLSISVIGTVVNNTCVNSAGTTALMTAGRLSLSSSSLCTFTGRFLLGNVPHTIRHSTLSKDKISIKGVGVFPTGAFSFSLTKL